MCAQDAARPKIKKPDFGEGQNRQLGYTIKGMEDAQGSLNATNHHLSPAVSGGGTVEALPGGGQRLTVPAGSQRVYRLAQLDDTRGLRRGALMHQPPCRLSLRARVSAENLPGTWGFGLWNDPFSAALGLGGGTRKLPTLPQAAWFFHAAPHNWLSLRDDLPANGFLAATFASRQFSPLLLVPALAASPLLLWRVTAGWLRRLARRWVRQDALRLTHDPTEWHAYRLDWRREGVSFSVDGAVIFETRPSPTGPLGLVIWIDNQYAAFTTKGQLSYGLEVSAEAAWLEIDELTVESGG